MYYFQIFQGFTLGVRLPVVAVVSGNTKPGTVEPRYNAVDGVHDFGPRCKRGALGVLISATRELLNNSDRCPLHQVHEPCRSPVCLQYCLIRQYAVYGT